MKADLVSSDRLAILLVGVFLLMGGSCPKKEEIPPPSTTQFPAVGKDLGSEVVDAVFTSIREGDKKRFKSLFSGRDVLLSEQTWLQWNDQVLDYRVDRIDPPKIRVRVGSSRDLYQVGLQRERLLEWTLVEEAGFWKIAEWREISTTESPPVTQ